MALLALAYYEVQHAASDAEDIVCHVVAIFPHHFPCMPKRKFHKA